MDFWRLAIGLLVLLMPIAATAEPRQVDVAGQARTYELHVPARVRAAGQSVALVVALHGGGGSGTQFRKQLQLDVAADREGFVVAYPDSLGRGWARRWNDGRTFANDRSAGPEPDDVAFIRALIRDVGSETRIDPERIFATGASNGGMMSFRLACEASDVFAAIAPMIANLSVELSQSCQPVRPVGVLMMTGTADLLVPFAGGPVGFKGERGNVIGADDTFAVMRRLNGCPERLKTASRSASIEMLGVGEMCAGGRHVRHYWMRGAGHQIPRKDAQRMLVVERLLGVRNTEVEAAEEIWAFFAIQGR